MLNHDELIRKETTMQSLASLEPSFSKIGKNSGLDEIALMKYPEKNHINHVHHAGNSSV